MPLAFEISNRLATREVKLLGISLLFAQDRNITVVFEPMRVHVAKLGYSAVLQYHFEIIVAGTLIMALL